MYEGVKMLVTIKQTANQLKTKYVEFIFPKYSYSYFIENNFSNIIIFGIVSYVRYALYLMGQLWQENHN